MEIIERFKIKEFLENSVDDTKEFDKLVSLTKKNIKKLTPKKWNSYYYDLRIKTVDKLNVFGSYAEIIDFVPLDTVVWEKDAVTHTLQWCPYGNYRSTFWLYINGKRFKLESKGKAEYIERQIIKKTLEFSKGRTEICKYAEKEIKKVVEHLKSKYPEKEFENLIRMNTDPDYWY